MQQMTFIDKTTTGEGERFLECHCGCGTKFVQPKVGRIRMYLDDKHKERAYRERARQNALKGDELMAFAEWIGGVCDAMERGANWIGAPDTVKEFFAGMSHDRYKMWLAMYDAIKLFREG